MKMRITPPLREQILGDIRTVFVALWLQRIRLRLRIGAIEIIADPRMSISLGEIVTCVDSFVLIQMRRTPQVFDRVFPTDLASIKLTELATNVFTELRTVITSAFDFRVRGRTDYCLTRTPSASC